MEPEDGSPSQGAPMPGVPPASAESASAEAGTDDFPAEVATFLRVLATAVQKFSMYPSAHPALELTAEGVLAALHDALRERQQLSIGIGSRQLAFEGLDSNPDHPRYSFLATRLHRHQLATVTFEAGISRQELEAFLTRVSVEAERCELPLGTVPPAELPPWPHLRVRPIRYEKLGLAHGTAEGTAGRPPSGQEAPGESRSERLWLGFARLALLHEATQGDADTASPTGSRAAPDGESDLVRAGKDDTDSLARALEELSSESGYAEEVLSRLVEISRELKSTHGAETFELRRRTSRLVSLVSPDALRRVLREGGDASERRQLLLDASQWMEPTSVVRLVRATAGVEKQDISHWLLLLMSKLAQHAESGSGRVRTEAEVTLREQVAQLVTDWALEDAVPEEYGAVLERMSVADTSTGVQPAAEFDVEPERLLMLGLELDTAGELVWDAVTRMLDACRFADLFELLEQAPSGSEAARALWDGLGRPETMRRILAAKDPDFDAIDRLLAHGGPSVADPMLDTLANSGSRSVRRQLFSRLAALGPAVGPRVVRWLDDERWFVQRNMLALMGELDRWPRKWTPATYVGHPHPAVRREALKLMLRLLETRDMAVRALLEDDDPRSLALGVAAAQESPPEEAVPLLLAIAERPSLPAELRAQAVRALACHPIPEARDVLLRLTREEAGTLGRLFGLWRLAARDPAMLEALSALHRGWPDDPEARRVLAQAVRSEDEAVRAAARGRAES